ncbi:MAG: hypothetical protein J5973_07040 [Eubacterium sp.]|nr:hypothetical protein [Eubacterium sp.]
MKGKKILAGGVLLVMTAALLSGCSVSDIIGKVTGRSGTDTAESVSVSTEGEKLDSRIIDPTLEKPVFQEGMAGEKDVQAGTELVLETQASVTDGGVITYQWYSNNVSSNGGGTLLKDMRESTYRPDTSKGGTTYYYVLATNTKDGKVNLSTSDVYKVTVWEDMYWQQNADLGAYQYISRIDGKFPKAVSIVIDGAQYHFDADGFAVNENGEYIDVQTGQPIPAQTPAAAPAEETPAAAPAEETPAAAPAEEAPAAAPAEEVPAEAVPAEEAPAQ